MSGSHGRNRHPDRGRRGPRRRMARRCRPRRAAPPRALAPGVPPVFAGASDETSWPSPSGIAHRSRTPYRQCTGCSGLCGARNGRHGSRVLRHDVALAVVGVPGSWIWPGTSAPFPAPRLRHPCPRTFSRRWIGTPRQLAARPLRPGVGRGALRRRRPLQLPAPPDRVRGARRRDTMRTGGRPRSLPRSASQESARYILRASARASG